jgi:hypothetical protein
MIVNGNTSSNKEHNQNGLKPFEVEEHFWSFPQAILVVMSKYSRFIQLYVYPFVSEVKTDDWFATASYRKHFQLGTQDRSRKSERGDTYIHVIGNFDEWNDSRMYD